jgi:hypothetical protein
VECGNYSMGSLFHWDQTDRYVPAEGYLAARSFSLQLANQEKRILITNDKDFGELIFLQKRISAGAILFRVKGQRTQEKIKLMKKLLMGYRDKLLNHYVVISKVKIRIVPLGDKR